MKLRLLHSSCSACKPSSLGFCPQVFFHGTGFSLIGVFPTCLLKGNHHQDICKVSRLWSIHRKLKQREIQLLWVTFRGWIYCLFGLVLQQLVVKPKPHVLAPPEIKVPSFFSYLRQEIFNIAFCNSRERNTEAHMLSFPPHSNENSELYMLFEYKCVFQNL